MLMKRTLLDWQFSSSYPFSQVIVKIPDASYLPTNCRRAEKKLSRSSGIPSPPRAPSAPVVVVITGPFLCCVRYYLISRSRLGGKALVIRKDCFLWWLSRTMKMKEKENEKKRRKRPLGYASIDSISCKIQIIIKTPICVMSKVAHIVRVHSSFHRLFNHGVASTKL